MENRLVKVYLTEILYIKGYGDYVKIYMTEGRVLLSLQSLNKLETLLPENFVRVHRSFIIALDKISEIEHRRIKIDQELIPIGESYLDELSGQVLRPGPPAGQGEAVALRVSLFELPAHKPCLAE